jgi:hypothetical protein
MWFRKEDEYFYTALLIKKLEKEREVFHAILVTNKPSDGFTLEVHPVVTPLKTLETFVSLDGKEKLIFYEWMFDWLLETKQPRKVRIE